MTTSDGSKTAKPTDRFCYPPSINTSRGPAELAYVAVHHGADVSIVGFVWNIHGFVITRCLAAFSPCHPITLEFTICLLCLQDGTMGHYTCFVLRHQRTCDGYRSVWFRCNDSVITVASSETVMRQTPCILCYRIQPFGSSSFARTSTLATSQPPVEVVKKRPRSTGNTLVCWDG